MNKKFIFGILLLILFSTFISQNKNLINKYIVKEIQIDIENNEFMSVQELQSKLSFLYEKNIIFMNSYDIEKKLEKNGFIKYLQIKKIYPNKLIIKINEKKPIFILINGEKKHFLNEKMDLIEYKNISKYKKLPIIYGDKKNFKNLFGNLKKLNFPIYEVEKYFLFKTKRWDLHLNDNKIIKLPIKNYDESIKNFIILRKNRDFDKYKVFDYRLYDQIILK
tara:strand:- start:188 stop:850 length:663 start_codon:yes stop_codon:yes gene_type:complete